MRQVAFVALYGQKRGALVDLIEECWRIVHKSSLRDYFKPRNLEQIHGTIVGMERIVGHKQLLNVNFWNRFGEDQAMNLLNITEVSRQHLPLPVRIGGFTKDYDAFSSQGALPHFRSIGFNRHTYKLVLIGWPHVQGAPDPQDLLLGFRDDLGRECGTLHAYEDDNDFYMVIGEMKNADSLKYGDDPVILEALSDVECKLRKLLEDCTIELLLDANLLFLVSYVNNRLPLRSSEAYRLSDYEITCSLVERLYGLR